MTPTTNLSDCNILTVLQCTSQDTLSQYLSSRCTALCNTLLQAVLTRLLLSCGVWTQAVYWHWRVGISSTTGVRW